jgi:hypothetical protein
MHHNYASPCFCLMVPPICSRHHLCTSRLSVDEGFCGSSIAYDREYHSSDARNYAVPYSFSPDSVCIACSKKKHVARTTTIHYPDGLIRWFLELLDTLSDTLLNET